MECVFDIQTYDTANSSDNCGVPVLWCGAIKLLGYVGVSDQLGLLAGAQASDVRGSLSGRGEKNSN